MFTYRLISCWGVVIFSLPLQASVWSQDRVLTTSLELSIEDLFSKEKGLLHEENREKRGRLWEREGLLIVKNSKGKPLVERRVGVRMHGGSSRRKSDNSFRVYFRKNLDRKIKTKSFFKGKIGKPKSLVVHRANDLVNFVAFDLASTIGAEVPETQASLFELNGEPKGLYFLSEHLKHKEWIKKEVRKGKRLKSEDRNKVYYYKFKKLHTVENKALLEDANLSYEQLYEVSDDGHELVSAREMKKTKDLMLDAPKMSLELAQKHFRLENLALNLLSIVISGNTDWRQGIAVKETDRDNKWHFINWDMEHSFFDKHQKNVLSKKGPVVRSLWQQEGFELIMSSGVKWWKQGLESQRRFEKWDVRAIVFYRLWMEDVAFRKMFRKLFDQSIKKLDQAWVEAALAGYESFSQKNIYSADDVGGELPNLEGFFSKRFAFLERQLQALEATEVNTITFDRKAAPEHLNPIWAELQSGTR